MVFELYQDLDERLNGNLPYFFKCLIMYTYINLNKRCVACLQQRYTYNALLCAYEKGGQWQQAETVLEEMVQVGGPVAPDTTTYNSVIATYTRAGQLKQVSTQN